MRPLFTNPWRCKLTSILFLMLALAGPTAFPTPASADKIRSAFSELDAELAVLVNTRDSLAIQRKIESGRIPKDYLFNEKTHLVVLFAEYKLSELFQFVASASIDEINPEQLVHIFRKNIDFPSESFQIVRHYITEKYDQIDRVQLDFYDSLFFVFVMCDFNPFDHKELEYIFNGMNISIDIRVYKELSFTFDQKHLILVDRYQCLRYVGDRVGFHPNEILEFENKTNTGDLK